MCSKEKINKESLRFYLCLRQSFGLLLFVLGIFFLSIPTDVQAFTASSYSISKRNKGEKRGNFSDKSNLISPSKKWSTASRLKITGNPTQVAGETQTITISALNNQGHLDETFNQTLFLKFYGANAIDFIDSTNLQSPGGSVFRSSFVPKINNKSIGLDTSAITFNQGIAQVDMQLFKNEVATIWLEEWGNTLTCQDSDRLTVDVNNGTERQINIQGRYRQYNRIPLEGKYMLTIVDQYYNVIKDFDPVSNPVGLRLSNLPGTFYIPSEQRNILNRASDFQQGVADLQALGFIYSGKVSSGGNLHAFFENNQLDSYSIPIVFYGGKGQTLQLKVGSSNSITRNAGATIAISLNLFDVDGNLAAYSLNGTAENVTREAVFQASPQAALTGQISKIGNKSIGEKIDVLFSNGGNQSSNLNAQFYFPETFIVSATMWLADGSQISTNKPTEKLQITINPGVVNKFRLNLTSPQISGISFVGTNELTALDAFDNVVTSYNAAITSNAVSITSSGLNGASSLTLGGNVLNRSTDFVNGVANLSNLGLKFVGDEGAGIYTFRKQSGNISVSAPMTILPGDRDNDNLNDTYERGGNLLALQDIDSDGDGIPDYLDADSDLDGISDRMELGNDTDSDGIPNYLDSDSDNDGIPDQVESNQDNDGDGIANYQDLDSDNDGILDGKEGHGDKDQDGKLNFLDADSDNDGILDVWEAVDINRGTIDQNYDGKVDIGGVFQDCNGNGIGDMLEIGFGGKPANLPDTDKDGIPDYWDEDSDGDSLLDRIELTSDPDGDGIPNYRDLDSDGDWLGDSDERDGDNDLDGKFNFLDDDSDNDGIPDAWEGKNKCATCQSLQDENGDGWDDRGQYMAVIDTDQDGQPDFLDADSDNDILPDRVELGADFDGDGMANFRDLDSDNDGILDQMEVGSDVYHPRDSDRDGLADFEDADSDNDGLLDIIEVGKDSNHPADFDLDGVPDYIDVDADGDGILDVNEVGNNPVSPVDSDQDGSPDYLDMDSDNDGIVDAVEKGANSGKPMDSDLDTIPDFRDLDSDQDGIPDKLEAGKNPSNPVDTDADGIANYLDVDSDNDGRWDNLEAGKVPTNPLDTDADGFFDYEEIDADNDFIKDSIEYAGDPINPVDTDADGSFDYLDLDSDNDGIPDKIEVGSKPSEPIDSDSDGKMDFRDEDSDGDQISDAIEAGLDPSRPIDTDGDGILNYLDLDSDNDGYVDSLERGPQGIPIDFDQDGLADYIDLDSDNDKISDKIEVQPFSLGKATDTDKDVKPDYQDLDSDNDTILDFIEVGPNFNLPMDSDQDGIPNFRDVDSDGDGIPDKMEVGKDPLKPLDSDKDGIPDFQDMDSDNNGVNDREEVGPDPSNPLDTDKDGIFNYLDSDDDGDGLLDYLENDINFGGIADCDHDGIPNQLDSDICDTYLTNGFSPNGDGTNDTFVIPGIMNLPNHHISIFNRWGNLVYETDNYKNDWEGVSNNADALLTMDGKIVDGIYYYIIDFGNVRPMIQSYLYINRLKNN
ncbi:gliding motility-associated C-terminal domain-containing protein [Aquirufa aurantiipilula]